jgi:hypothetical protein
VTSLYDFVFYSAAPSHAEYLMSVNIINSLTTLSPSWRVDSWQSHCPSSTIYNQGCSNPLAQLQCHSSLCVHKCLYTLLCFNIIYSLINTSVLAACKILSHKDLPLKNVSASQSGCKDKYVACIIGSTFNALMSSFTFSSTLHAIGQVKSVSPASFMLYGMLLACSCTATALRAPLKSQLYCVVLVSTRSPAPEWEFVAYWMPGRDCP